MRIWVQKYGGSSVADVGKVQRVAERIKACREAGVCLVVVVSAMGDTTDELLGLARKVSSNPPRRELDMLLTCGERISMALLCMALDSLGVPAISFTGSQSGILTDDNHSQARILEVRPARLLEALAQGKVVVVAGYQGVSRQREVTTLGRGGSDTTAVALAAALEAEACDIYSDVDGVFSADPRVVPEAVKLEQLSYEEMQELASAGARVLNAQAVEFARTRGITVHARSTFGGGTGTTLAAEPRGGAGVKAVTSDADVGILSWNDATRPASLFAWLDAERIRPRLVATGAQGEGFLVFCTQDLHGEVHLRQALAQAFGSRVSWVEGLGTVTLVGTGLDADLGPLRTALEVAAALDAPLHAVHTSPLQVTVVTQREKLQSLTQRLHQALVEASN